VLHCRSPSLRGHMRPASYVPGELIPLPLSGSIPELPHVAKVSLGGQPKFFSAADAFCERRRERPHRFIQNRPGTSVAALKSDTAAEKSKDQLSRDFPGRSIFDFCNMGTKRPFVRRQPRLEFTAAPQTLSRT